MATIFRRTLLHQMEEKGLSPIPRFSAFCFSFLNASSIRFSKDLLHNESYLPKTSFSTSSKISSITPISMSYTLFNSGDPPDVSPSKSPIIIMHGLFGSKTNWRSLAKALSSRTRKIVYTVDARNHGDSPHTDDLNYVALAEDIALFLKERGLSQAHLVGHSMGGRAMMAMALLYPNVVDKLFVLDISPVGKSDAPSAMMRFVQVMRTTEIPSHLEITEGRKFMGDILKPHVQEAAIRNFLLANLLKKDGRFQWKVNLDAVYNHFNEHLRVFPFEDGRKQFRGTTHFLAGSLSDYIRASDHDAIKTIFPKADFHYLAGAGHWLHADKPQEFLDLIVPLVTL